MHCGNVFTYVWSQYVHFLCSWLVPGHRWLFFLHAVPAGKVFRCDGCNESQHVRFLCSWLVSGYRWVVCLQRMSKGRVFKYDRFNYLHPMCHGYIFSDKWPLYLCFVCSWLIPKNHGQYCVSVLFCREFSE